MASGTVAVKIVGDSSQLTATLTKMQGEIGALLGRVDTEVAATNAKVEESAGKAASAGKGLKNHLNGILGLSGLLGAAMPAALGAIGVSSVKMADDFESSTTQLVTGAGESATGIDKIRQSLLALAPQVGATPQELASGLYMIESAGFHGADGLKVLQAAAEGAKVGAADMASVSDALTTILHDYKIPAADATQVTSQLVATVSQGKTHMQDLAGALSTVLPTASAAGVGLNQVLGAMATMTAGGTPAADAATQLRMAILQLANPTTKAKDEMSALGLDANEVAGNLGKVGLTGTIQTLTDAITAHMGPSGLVVIQSLKGMQGASQSLSSDLAKLPPDMQKLANEFANGQVSSKEYNKEIGNLSPQHQALMKSVADLILQEQGFRKQVKGSSPEMQTYIGALADMTGGTKSMAASLVLGQNMSTFAGDVQTIGDAAKGTGKHVKGWSEIQKDNSQKLAEAKAQWDAAQIKLGQGLAPVISGVIVPAMSGFSAVIGFLSQHLDVAIPVVAALAAVLLYTMLPSWETVTAAFEANPIGAIIAGVVLAVTLLATHWTQVTQVVAVAVKWLTDRFRDFENGVAYVVNGVVEWFDQIHQGWDRITTAIKTGVEDFVGFFQKLPGRIGGAVAGMWDGIKTAFRDVIDWVIDRWNDFAKVMHVDVGPVHFGLPTFPHIPAFATGGVIPGIPGQPTLAVVHAGERISSNGAGSGGGGVNVYVQSQADPHMIGREVAWAMRVRG